MKLKFPIAIPWGRLQLPVAVVLALAAFAGFGYWALSLADRSEQVQVVAAARDLKEALYVLRAEDIQSVALPRGAAPSTAIAQTKDAVGLTLIHPVSQNQILTINELFKGVDQNLEGARVPQGRYGLTLPAAWFAGPIPKVQKGDTLTLIVSAAGKAGEKNTGVLASAVPVLRAEAASDGTVQRLAVAVDLDTAVKLLQVRANNVLLQIILEGKGPPLRPL